ncbi:MAG: putative zinc ribbon domain protein, partial [Phycisphaerales bacterium]|nr:putative zinc ribbon domain protein [Phycisphaerales bacterium]
NELSLEIQAREQKVEKLREQQNGAQNNREYQAFLVEINTQKVDRAKFEEEALGVMEQLEKRAAELTTLAAQHETEQTKLDQMSSQIGDRVKMLTGEIEKSRPARDEAAKDVPEKAMHVYNRLADRYEGEAMEAIDKPHPKREEYIAMSCNIDLTVDVYNRLHSRDDLVFCPQCGRILYIPEELTVEKAVHKPKVKKERKPAVKRVKKEKVEIGAPVQRQTLASSVVTSVDEDEEETAAVESSDVESSDSAESESEETSNTSA